MTPPLGSVWLYQSGTRTAAPSVRRPSAARVGHLKIAGLFILTTGFCCPLFEDCSTPTAEWACDEHSAASVVSVAVFPRTVEADRGAEFMWQARPVDPNGVPVQGPHDGDWLPRPIVEPLEDDKTVARANVPMNAGSYGDITATIGAATSQAALVRVGTDADASRIFVEHLSSEAPAGLLLDGMLNSTDGTSPPECKNDLSFGLAGGATVPGFAFKIDCSEAVLFTRGKAVHRVVPEPTTGTGQILKVVRSELYDRRAVDVHVIDRTDGDALSNIEVELPGSSTLFDENRTGIEFYRSEPIKVLPKDYLVVPTSFCDSVTELAPLLGVDDEELTTTDPNSVKLYVVYVPQLEGDSRRGKICYRDNQPVGEPQLGSIVVLVAKGNSAVTLPHELGHALLGKNQPHPGPASNLMSDNTLSCEGSMRAQLWLGQAFRMNLDWDSWLLAHLNDDDRRERGARECQLGPWGGECPAIRKDIANAL